MSEIGTVHTPDEDDGHLLAAEYVLGLLEPSERAAVSRRAETDRGFAGSVAHWELRLAPLADEIAPVPPPADLWTRIEAELRGERTAAATARQTSPDAAKSAAKGAGGVWDSLAFWRGFGLGSAALALASIAALVFVAQPRPQPGDLVAALSQTDGRASFAAFVDRTTGQVALVPVVLADTPADHSHELWIIVPGSAPRSLGIFNASAPAALTLPKNLLGAAGPAAQLAISVEPVGGSPTGLPTGPVIASGALKDI